MKTYSLSSSYIAKLKERVSKIYQEEKESQKSCNKKDGKENPFMMATRQVFQEDNLENVFESLFNFQSFMSKIFREHKKGSAVKKDDFLLRDAKKHHQALENQIERLGLNRDSYF